uniref:Ovule protein n=1 Tax=Caenorhabditis tropicalis TaxID=1561998 RepID=A0A1I7TTY2_9PELO
MECAYTFHSSLDSSTSLTRFLLPWLSWVGARLWFGQSRVQFFLLPNSFFFLFLCHSLLSTHYFLSLP